MIGELVKTAAPYLRYGPMTVRIEGPPEAKDMGDDLARDAQARAKFAKAVGVLIDARSDVEIVDGQARAVLTINARRK